MPFIIPKKRTSLSRNTRFSKYSDLEQSPDGYLLLQQKKPQKRQNKKYLSRPNYRIITVAYPRYEVAYGNNLDEFKENEWHHCVTQLKMPASLREKQSVAQWLIAHFTQLAINEQHADADGPEEPLSQESSDEELDSKENSPTSMSVSKRRRHSTGQDLAHMAATSAAGHAASAEHKLQTPTSDDHDQVASPRRGSNASDNANTSPSSMMRPVLSLPATSSSSPGPPLPPRDAGRSPSLSDLSRPPPPAKPPPAFYKHKSSSSGLASPERSVSGVRVPDLIREATGEDADEVLPELSISRVDADETSEQLVASRSNADDEKTDAVEESKGAVHDTDSVSASSSKVERSTSGLRQRKTGKASKKQSRMLKPRAARLVSSSRAKKRDEPDAVFRYDGMALVVTAGVALNVMFYVATTSSPEVSAFMMAFVNCAMLMWLTDFAEKRLTVVVGSPQAESVVVSKDELQDLRSKAKQLEDGALVVRAEANGRLKTGTPVVPVVPSSTVHLQVAPVSSASAKVVAVTLEHDEKDADAADVSSQVLVLAEKASSEVQSSSVPVSLDDVKQQAPRGVSDDADDSDPDSSDSDSGKIRYGTTFMKGDPQNLKAEQQWAPLVGDDMPVRIGPDYTRNKLKSNSGPCMYDIIAVDLVATSRKVLDMSEYLEYPTAKTVDDPMHAKALSQWQKELGIPALFVLNAAFPAYAPSLMSSKQDGENHTMVMFMVMNEQGYKAVKEGLPSGRLLKRFMLNCDDKSYSERFKCIPRVPAHSPNGLPGLLAKYNGKPFLTRPQHKFRLTETYFEAFIDIHEFQYMAKKAFHQLSEQKFTQMVLDIGFTIEGKTDDELPEQVLFAMRASRLNLRELQYLEVDQ